MSTSSEILGYEQRRPELEEFVDRHYIEQFAISPSTMIDAGCGDGFWTDIFARRGFAPTGVDVERRAIDAAHRRCQRTAETVGYPPGCRPEFYNVDLANLTGTVQAPFIFARTLPHFYAPTLEPGTELVAQLLRHLVGDGRILISIYSDQSARTIEGATHHHLGFIVRAVMEGGAAIAATGVRDGYLQVLARHPTPDERIAA